eukprot:TRINITY_DN3932_c0_g2_i1.p1 TRINITY_DN3932_c0_g2~~TRINITY_DN3932_c0_g2_i1.p1  ORF type:complete len:465 (-),score=94.14 TRINITY_DN3932_c0_g2_i1:142-1536(-)
MGVCTSKNTKQVKPRLIQLPDRKLLSKENSYNGESPKSGDSIRTEHDFQYNGRNVSMASFADIGKGASSTVRRGSIQGSDRLFAMKMINKKLMKKIRLLKSQPRGRRRGPALDSNIPDIEEEIKIWKMLVHPNIVELCAEMDDKESESLCLVAEYMDKGALCKDASTCIPIASDKLQRYMVHILNGLKYMHSKLIIHRDIKPANLLLNSTGVCKINDFGTSKILKSADETVHDSQGTMAYHAPEMTTGEPFSGQSVDVWAFGTTFYFLAFGQLPFQSPTYTGLYASIRNNEPDYNFQDSETSREVDKGLVEFLKTVLVKDPKKRPSIQELLDHPYLHETAVFYERSKALLKSKSLRSIIPLFNPQQPQDNSNASARTNTNSLMDSETSRNTNKNTARKHREVDLFCSLSSQSEYANSNSTATSQICFVNNPAAKPSSLRSQLISQQSKRFEATPLVNGDTNKLE